MDLIRFFMTQVAALTPLQRDLRAHPEWMRLAKP